MCENMSLVRRYYVITSNLADSPRALWRLHFKCLKCADSELQKQFRLDSQSGSKEFSSKQKKGNIQDTLHLR